MFCAYIFKKGFTLIELLIVLAVLLIVLGSSVVAFYTLTRKTDLDASRDNIATTLNTAKNKTLASEGAGQYGVYFDDSSNDTSSDPHKYILFQGSSYADASFKETHILPATVEISNLSFSGAGDEVVFNRLEGKTGNNGLIVIKFLATGETRTIYVYSSGEVSTQSESASGAGRITDSRHVHFDYDRAIGTATEKLILTFDTVVTEEIIIADNLKDGQIYWEGEVDVNGETQKVTIHTHRLNNPGTQFCIHRDRRYNNKSLVIAIDGDGSGSLISYTADGQESRGISIYLAIGGAGDPQPQ